MASDKRSFYLGRELDTATGADTGRRLQYDADDLTTHAVCFGMTGSGKTGLCVVLLEEAIRAGIPVFMIDPKGDLANLLLTFPGLSAEEFEPWVDPDQARAAGQTTRQLAETVAARWRQGLGGSGLGPDDVRALRDSAEFVLSTPGSTAAAPLNVLGGFGPEPAEAESAARQWEADPEPLRSRIAATVAALMDLISLEADPVKSPEGIFLARLFELQWRQGRKLTLETMIRELQDPSAPMRTMGAMDLETMLPRARRTQMAMALNGLVAAPAFAAWAQGEPLDIGRMARSTAPAGKPRACVLHIAHLSDRERSFFVTAFLQALIGWMRAQPGSSSLRALFYMDEIFGYFPPSANPPAKEPMLTLLKQARAYGLGVVLATQNPVDVDYKGLANAGTWFLGKLQTEQDRARLLDGLSGAGIERPAVEKALAGLPARSFLVHNVHQPGLQLLGTRWAMSYLRGPMTREEIRRLGAAARASERPVEAAGPAAGSAPVIEEKAARGAAATGGRPVREPAPSGISELFVAAPAGSLMAPALRARARVTFEDRATGTREVVDEHLLLPLAVSDQPATLDWSQAAPIQSQTSSDPPSGASFEDLPDAFRSAGAYRTAARDLQSYLMGARGLKVYRNASLALASTLGETESAFRDRCKLEAEKRAGAQREELGRKYEEKLRRLQARAEKEMRELDRDKQDLQGRKMDEIVNAGETLLGMFMGRRRSLSSVASRRRMTASSGARLDKSQAEYDAAREDLERMQQEAAAALGELAAQSGQMADDIAEVRVTPKKSGVEVLETGLCWAPKIST